MLNWIRDWWHARTRKLDLEILWPTCKRLAPSMDHARAAFAYHAFHDAGWLALGEEEIERRIEELT